MRIAAGVLLLIVAVLYVLGGLAYLAGGAATAGAGGLGEMAAKEMAKEGKEMTAEQKKAMEELKSKGTAAGGGLMFYGIFLLVGAGISIAAAVSLFQSKRQKLIFVAGAVVIIAEIAGMLLTSFGLTQIIGIVAAVLAFLAAKSFGEAAAGGGSESAPAA